MNQEIVDFQDIAAIQGLFTAAIEFSVNYGFQIVGAIMILIIGFWIAKRVAATLERLCLKKGLDVTLAKFFANVTRTVVLVFVIIIALGKFGITMTPFIAALGAIAFGSSLALAGPLSNYGAGISIIISRPFVVGNTISVKGFSGVVEEVRLAATYLKTEDGETIIIPNKEIVGEPLINSFANKVVELVVGISYDDDPNHAAQTICNALASVDGVVMEPAPQIGILKFGESSIDVAVRYWVPTARYFQSQFAANNAVWQSLSQAGITIPYPKRELNIVKGEL